MVMGVMPISIHGKHSIEPFITMKKDIMKMYVYRKLMMSRFMELIMFAIIVV